MSEQVLDSVPLFHLELVKDRDIPVGKLDPRNLVGSAVQVLHAMLDSSPTEQFVALYIASDMRIIGAEKIAIGSLESVNVHMGNLFRGALVANAPSMIISHNHPQGAPTASVPDWLMTDTAILCSELVGVKILDHIIVSPNGTHYSCWDHKDDMIAILKAKIAQEQLKAMFLKMVPSSRGPFGTDLDEFKRQMGGGLLPPLPPPPRNPFK